MRVKSFITFGDDPLVPLTDAPDPFREPLLLGRDLGDATLPGVGESLLLPLRGCDDDLVGVDDLFVVAEPDGKMK